MVNLVDQATLVVGGKEVELASDASSKKSRAGSARSSAGSYCWITWPPARQTARQTSTNSGLASSEPRTRTTSPDSIPSPPPRHS